MVANIVPTDPLPTLRMGSVSRNLAFSEHGNSVYQSKKKHKCSSNMVANVLPTDPYPLPQPWGWGQKAKIQHFRKWPRCISDWRKSQMQQHGSKYFARIHVPQLNPTPTPSPDPIYVKRSKFNFFRTWSCCISNYKENHECNNIVANILPEDPLPTRPQGDGVKRSKINFFRTWSYCISK